MGKILRELNKDLSAISFDKLQPWALKSIQDIFKDIDSPHTLIELEKSCRTGSSQIFTTEKSYFILKPYCKNNNFVVFVWAAGSISGHGIKNHFDDVVNLSKMVKASKLEMITMKKSVMRLCKMAGWKLVSNINNQYYLEVCL